MGLNSERSPEPLHGALALFWGKGTCHHSMKPQLGIEAPVGQPFGTIVRAEWIRDIAIIREQRHPPMSSGRIYHAHVQCVCIVIE